MTACRVCLDAGWHPRAGWTCGHWKEIATVTVTGTVDGTKRRRTSGVRRTLATLDRHVKVDPRIWRAAQNAVLPGQRLVIVSEHEVRIVNS